MTNSKLEKKITFKIFMFLCFIGTFLFIILSFISFWTNIFVGEMVKNELTAQKIYFPELGSPLLKPSKYPGLQQYAGQLVDTPQKAKAFANEYIGTHLKDIGGGKVYSEVSSEAMKDPENEDLQKQKQALFQGETLRGMLLTSGYGFGTMAEIAGIVAWIALFSSLVTTALGFYFYKKMQQNS